MSKLALKTILISVLLITTVFADEELSQFNKQGGTDYPRPKPEEDFFATRAPMASEFRRYFGLKAGLGYTSLKSKLQKDSVDEKTPDANVFGFAAGAYAGLGINFDHFYLGTELSGGYNSADRTIASDSGTKIKATQPIVAGLDLIPGYLTQQKDFLFYGRLGVGASLFKFKIDEDSESNYKKIALGWRAGLGMEYFMNDTVSMRVEYIWNNYKEIKKNYTTTGGTSYDYEFSSPHTQQIHLGLTFNF